MAKAKTSTRAPAKPADRDLETPTDLRRNEVNKVADALNGIIADAFALQMKTRNFHWHVKGPHFRDYHLLFDEQIAEIGLAIDPMAERVRKIGGTTLTSIGDIARRQTIRDSDTLGLSASEMLAELREDNLACIKAMRDARELADEAKDGATSSLIDDQIDAAEKRAWFLFQAAQTG